MHCGSSVLDNAFHTHYNVMVAQGYLWFGIELIGKHESLSVSPVKQTAETIRNGTFFTNEEHEIDLRTLRSLEVRFCGGHNNFVVILKSETWRPEL